VAWTLSRLLAAKIESTAEQSRVARDSPSRLSQTAHTAHHHHPTSSLASTRFARGQPASQLTLASQASPGMRPHLSVHHNCARRLDTAVLERGHNFSAKTSWQGAREPVAGRVAGGTWWWGASRSSSAQIQSTAEQRGERLDRRVSASTLCLVGTEDGRMIS